MQPPFDSPRQAGWFAALCLLILCGPWLLPSAWLDQRETVYSNASLRLGPYPWLQKKIFQDSGPADLVLAGSSHLWGGVSALELGKRIQDKVGRPAEVFTLGWPWPGYDALYFVIRDLLEKRRVRCLVIYDESCGSGDFHLAAYQWLRFQKDWPLIRGLPFRLIMQAYAASVLGVPKLVLSSLRPDGAADPNLREDYWQNFYKAPPVASQNGTLSSQLGLHYDPTFPPAPTFASPPAQAVAYESATRGAFRFSGTPLDPLQNHFLEKVVALGKKHGTKIVFLNFPLLDEAQNPEIQEKQCWPDRFGEGVGLLGIRPKDLFRGISEKDRQDLYYDPMHFNAHGQELYTRSILPELGEVYAK